MKYIIISILILYTVSIKAVPSKRIWNGNDAKPMLHVCMLHIFNTDNPYVGYLAGGTIISNRHVLTAAHVLEKASVINVGYGSNKRADLAIISTKGFIINSEYNPITRANDIGIIVLVGLPFAAGKFKAAILDDGTFPLPVRGTVAGFGFYTSNAQLPDILQYAEIEVRDNSYCNIFANAELSHHFCVFSTRPVPSHLCPGDIGTGFFTIEKVGKMGKEVAVLFGIASHIVQGCSFQDQPSLFIEIKPYKDWIQIFVPPKCYGSYDV